MHRRHGMTLVELLLVVFILAALAASASSMVEGAHDQARYDDTRTRISLIRRAIVGPDDPIIPTSGFVADMGRDPVSISELLENPNDPAGLYSVDALTGVGSGWRGPYLRASPRFTNGAIEFPDGWGTPDQFANDPNFGWRFDTQADNQKLTDPLGERDVRVTSRGADGVLDYVKDASTSIEVTRPEHHVNVGPWRVEVQLHPTGALPPNHGLALRVWVPNGSGGVVPIVGDKNDVTLTPGVDPPPFEIHFDTEGVDDERWVPHGIRAVELCSHDGSASGGDHDLATRRFIQVDFRPQASLPIRLTRPFEVAPPPP